jgi:protein-tyrosine phosphatase
MTRHQDLAATRLAGSAAFRDLGGAPAADGRHVAHRRLFRSDALATLGDADREIVRSLAIRLVCDLRGPAEREREPCLAWLDAGIRRLHLDVSAGLAPATAEFVERLRRGPDPAAAAAMMQATYAQMPHSASSLLAQLFDALAEGEWPVLVHCTAGKDRTGFTVAMILTALGVPRDYIVEDYLRGSGHDPLHEGQPSARLLEAMVGRLLDREEAVLVHGVQASYLEAAFATIERDWGSPTTYLEQVAGLDAQRRRSLREHVLV